MIITIITTIIILIIIIILTIMLCNIRHRALVAREECLMPRVVPGRSVLSDFKGPTPPGLDRVSCGAAQFWEQFSDAFSTSFFDRCLTDFGGNLVPTCLPSWIQNPPKSSPRGCQIPCQLASCCRWPLESILGASEVDFWRIWGSKLRAKLIKYWII